MDRTTDFFDRLGVVLDDDYVDDMDDEYLEHHGVQGQKWGVMHGPPYPLDDNAAKQAKRKAAAAANAVKDAGEKAAEVISNTAKKTVKSIRNAQEAGAKRKAEKAISKAEKKAAKEAAKQEKLNAKKRKIIEEGDISEAAKNPTEFTNEEIQELVNRYAQLAKIKDQGINDQADAMIRKARTAEEAGVITQKIAEGDLDWAVANASKLTQPEMEDLVAKRAAIFKAQDFVSNYNAEKKNKKFDNTDKRSKSAASTAKNIIGISAAGLTMYNIAAKIHNARGGAPWPVIDLGDVVKDVGKETAKETTKAATETAAKAASAEAILKLLPSIKK